MFTHLSEPTSYTAEQLRVLARFPLITIEKFMGPFPLAAGRAEEDNIGDVAAAVKRINPNATVLLYLNSQFAYPWYHLFHLADRNDWWVVDEASGAAYTHRVINMNCTRPGHCPEASVGYWDFAEPALRAAWAAACTNASLAVDGCFVDGATSNPPFPASGDGAQVAAYEAGRNATFAAIAQKALIVINDKGYYDPHPPYPAVQGEFIETFSGDAVKWMQILNRTEDGHLVQAHTGTAKASLCHQPNSTEGVADLAAFLMVARRYTYFGCSNWEDVPTWPSVYDRPLGAPLGPAVQDSDGTWRRRFQRGTNASINFGTHVAHIEWGQGGPFRIE